MCASTHTCTCTCTHTHTCSVRAGLSTGNIEQGLEVTRNISKQANNAIHLSLIENLTNPAKLGALVLQDLFSTQETHRQVRRVEIVIIKPKGNGWRLG